MRVHNVHSRELAAPAARTWELVAGLASDHDQLWPTERWPTSPIVFDRPLGVGAEVGHGRSATTSSATSPAGASSSASRRGSGLDGLHGARGRAARRAPLAPHPYVRRRVEWKLRPLYRVLIKAHDAQVEDLLDNAERAVGGRPLPSFPLPRLVRVANALEGGFMRSRGWLMKLPDAAHTSRPWRIHALAPTSGSRTSGRCRRRAAPTTSRGSSSSSPPGTSRGAWTGTGASSAMRDGLRAGVSRALFALRW